MLLTNLVHIFYYCPYISLKSFLIIILSDLNNIAFSAILTVLDISNSLEIL